MALQRGYASIIEKIEKGQGLKKDEIAIVKEAVDRWFTENAVIANGIVSLVKLTADKKVFENIREIVANAKNRVEEGKVALTPEDKKKLCNSLSYLREESSGRIIKSIENGSVLFLFMLHNELNKVDIKELEKLERIIGNV